MSAEQAFRGLIRLSRPAQPGRLAASPVSLKDAQGHFRQFRDTVNLPIAVLLVGLRRVSKYVAMCHEMDIGRVKTNSLTFLSVNIWQGPFRRLAAAFPLIPEFDFEVMFE